MKIVGQVMTGTLGFVLLWTHLAFSSQPLSSYNFLQDVTVDRKDGELLIQLRFRKPPVHFQGPEFFKKSIQMDFPSAYVNPSKRYFDTGDDRVRQVYVSQFDPKRLRLRLILAPGASILREETVVEQVGRVLRIRINRGVLKPASIQAKSEISDPLESLLARASRIQRLKVVQTQTTSGQLPKPDLPAISSRVSQSTKGVKHTSSTKKNETTTPLLSQVLGQALKSEQPKKAFPSEPLHLKTKKAGILDFEKNLSVGQPDMFSASLKMAYTLILVLGLMFFVFYLVKKFGLRNSVFGGEGKPIKVLSTGFLAPRKSIALVEVAGDILVVGISNDQISLLSNVQDPDRIEQIKNTLHKKGHPRKPVAASPKPNDEVIPPQTGKEGKKPQAKKQGVDVYNKRLTKSGSTNPFGEYVKQFANSSDAEPPAMKDVASRVRKTLEEVPVFK
ncbi:MAG: flagellar biosynthetic protein FliO [Nitrospinaceae bacterium]